MKPLSPSRQALTRSDLRLVDPRRLMLGTACVSLVLAVAAFAGGIWVGRAHVEPVFVPVAHTEDSAREPQERFAAERIGELSGRLQVLEKDAAYLLKAVDSHEEIARKLSRLDPELAPQARATPSPARKPSVNGEGGILLPPRPCADPLPSADIDQSERSARCLRRVFDQLMDQVARRSADFMAIPARRPMEAARLGSPFGNRVDPFNRRLAFHSGQDFSAPTGSPIHAAAGGRVIVAGRSPSYGNRVEIDHGNGLVTRYAHASKLLVKVGDVVLPGREIAKVGSTGRSTGPHLHFEVLYHGEFVDPQNFLSLGGMEIDSDGMASD